MTNEELAKKVLKSITDEYFNVEVSATTGGKCSDGWGDRLELALSSAQILYLLQNGFVDSSLFDGLATEKVDIDDVISDMTMEAAWPDGGPEASVNNVIPCELSEIAKELESLDRTDKDAINRMREKVKNIQDGDYTFCFTVEASGYCFAEDVCEKIKLTSKEAIGILYGECNCDDVFEDICDAVFDEYDINKKAEDIGFASDYDNFSYSGECEELDAYLNAWEYIIDNILSGDITENDLDVWLEYFDDSENYEYEIVEWYDNREDEDEL